MKIENLAMPCIFILVGLGFIFSQNSILLYFGLSLQFTALISMIIHFTPIGDTK